jgi:hypothetical protein
MDDITPYRREPFPSIWRVAWVEGTGGPVQLILNAVAIVSAAILVAKLIPEDGKVPPGLEGLFAIGISVVLLVLFYLVRGPVRTERKRLKGAEMAISQREGVIAKYQQELDDRVPQSVIDELSRLRIELNREIWNKPPNDKASYGEWVARFDEWHGRTLALLSENFTESVRNGFEDIGVLNVEGFKDEDPKQARIIAWKMERLASIIDRHTRATPSTFQR